MAGRRLPQDCHRLLPRHRQSQHRYGHPLLPRQSQRKKHGRRSLIWKGKREHKAQPEPKVDPNPESVQREGWLPLADTREQFQHNWRQGDNRGNVFFDATNKTINIDGCWNLGGLTCQRKWKDFYCELDVSSVSFGRFDLAIKRASFKLGNALGKPPVRASLRIRLDNDSGNAVVLLNGVQVSQASVLDPKWMGSFDCEFSSQEAKLQLKNIHLLVYGRDTELLSDWTPTNPTPPEPEHKAQPEPKVDPNPESVQREGWLPLADTRDTISAKLATGRQPRELFLRRHEEDHQYRQSLETGWTHLPEKMEGIPL